MVRFDKATGRYAVVVGDTVKFRDTLQDALLLARLLQFGADLLRILPKQEER